MKPAIVYVDILHDYPEIGGMVEFSRRLFADLKPIYGDRLISAHDAIARMNISIPAKSMPYPPRESIAATSLAPAVRNAVFFFPNMQSPIRRDPRRADRAVVNIVHDVQYKYLPERVSANTARVLDAALRDTVVNADKLLFVSDTSRAQFVEHFGKPRRTRIIYAPIQSGAARGAESAPPGRPYLLSSCHLTRYHGHKNLPGILRLFHELSLRRSDLELRLTGLVGPAAQEAIGELPAETQARIVLLGFISREEMHEQYRSALAFVSLSFFEGFNMPAGEAASHRTPMILSDLPIHRELFSHDRSARGTCFVDPHAPAIDTVAQWLEQFATDPRAAEWPLREACRPEAVARRVAAEIDELAAKLKPAR